MMLTSAQSIFQSLLDDIRQSGLTKEERVLLSPQDAEISILGGQEMINFCANNYLGLDNHPDVIAIAQAGLTQYGFGLSSVRFICGTQTVHKQLEAKLSEFFGMEDTLLYTSCFDANGGLFEPLLDADCAVISDALNHASLIDGIRLCKAKRYRFAHGDMQELEQRLQDSQSAKIRLIATDGVFSMDGDIAKLEQICDLAEQYDALVMVDDSHGTGILGATGRGAVEHCGVMGRVDLITSTLGKALGGASGGFTTGAKVIIDLLRQRSRPYLFSNSLAPAIAYTSIKILDWLSGTIEFRDASGETRREQLMENTRYFRQQISDRGFQIKPGEHPIVPIMLYDAQLAQAMARDLLQAGIYVIGFSYPVVPLGQARIRVQLSAAHTRAHLDHGIAALTRVGQQYGVI
ncbi:MAG TPA: glycine C-acetyltransferase [Coleofasciculaceae cyanobacterium]